MMSFKIENSDVMQDHEIAIHDGDLTRHLKRDDQGYGLKNGLGND